MIYHYISERNDLLSISNPKGVLLLTDLEYIFAYKDKLGIKDKYYFYHALPDTVWETGHEKMVLAENVKLRYIP